MQPVRKPTTLVVLVLLLALSLTGCKKPYRVGDHVLVEWEKGKLYPAYVLEATGRTRYRVHFEGYDSRWDEDVSLDKIQGRVEGPVTAPLPPERVTRLSGTPAGSAQPGGGAHGFQAGDRVRVTWRGSVYAATVLEAQGKDRLLVHYEGHENAWDEVVSIDRVAGRRP